MFGNPVFIALTDATEHYKLNINTSNILYYRLPDLPEKPGVGALVFLIGQQEPLVVREDEEDIMEAIEDARQQQKYEEIQRQRKLLDEFLNNE